MKLKTTLAVLAVMLAPGMAFAYCGQKMQEETAASCAPGAIWDATRGACLANPTS